MHKVMSEVAVYTTDDHQIVIQSPDGRGDWDVVYLTPEQIETVIDWLKEAKAELLEEQRR